MMTFELHKQLPLAIVIITLATGLIANGQNTSPEPPAPAPLGAGAATNPNARNAQQQASLADGLFRRGQYGMAVGEYETLAREFPTFEKIPEAYLLWAISYERLEEPRKALNVYLELIEKFPASDAAGQGLVTASRLLVGQDAYEEARALLLQANVETLNPRLREAIHYYLGVAYNQLDQLDKAIEQFNHLKVNEFDDVFFYRPYAQMSKALIHRARREAGQAATLLQGLAESDKAPVELRQEALYYLGEISFGSERYEDAVTHYGRLMERFPASTYAAAARVNLGWSLLMLEKYREILRLYEGGAERPLSPGGDELYLMAAAAKQLNQFEAALDFLTRFNNQFPQSDYRSTAKAFVVESLYRLNRHEACIREGTEILTENPNHPRALEIRRFLGMSYQAMENWPKVAEVYSLLLDQHWEELTERETLLLILANAHERIGDPAKAAQTYRRILLLKDSSMLVEAMRLAAENEMQARQYQDAFDDYQRIVTGHPQHQQVPLALLGMAEAKWRLGADSEAITILNGFLENYPDHSLRSTALYLRGTLFFRLNRTKEAIADLARSLQEPNFEDRDLARLFLGYALWDEGKVDEALQLFADMLNEEALASKFSSEMLSEIGRKYLERNNIAAAERAWTLLAASPDLKLQLDGMIGLGKSAFQKNDYEKAREIFERVKRQADFQSNEHVIARAYLGESFRRLDMLNRAEIEFQEGLKLGTTDTNANALLYTGLAKLNYAQNNLRNALRYATFAFVVFSDPQHSPEAMLLAARISAEQNDMNEAMITFRELAQRFPIALARFKQDAANKDLIDRLEAADARRERPAERKPTE